MILLTSILLHYLLRYLPYLTALFAVSYCAICRILLRYLPYLTALFAAFYCIIYCILLHYLLQYVPRSLLKMHRKSRG
jgi:hypothetical protein